MAYAIKVSVVVPETSVYRDADRFWVQRVAVDVQVRLDGEDKVFLSYCNEHRREEMLTMDVPWSEFCVEFKALIERLKEQ